MSSNSNSPTIAFLGDYLPRKCGIATFTSDLLAAVAARHPRSCCLAVAVNDVGGCYEYPAVVRHEIEEQNLEDYHRAADFLNGSGVDVISLQHEFGIFGGPAGSHLLALLRLLKVPVVTTLHTVLMKPNDDQFRVMQELILHSERVVVMTQRGRAILEEVYRAPSERIDVIPHGIPDVSFSTPDSYKDQFGLDGKNVLLTFGLLSPNKGIENVLLALPRIVAEFPDLIYIVLGATHPHELRTLGEAYRTGLEAMAAKNGIESHVIFHNRFVDLDELTEFIGAADIYVTPYLVEAQITSGTLAYAFGAGKPVVSTPYWHAAELLAEQRGVLVPFADPGAIAREVSCLLRDSARREAMSRNAYELGRTMVWTNTAGLYMRSFEFAYRREAAAPISSISVSPAGRRPHASPEFNFEHLHQMTDSTGVFQHAKFASPSQAEGYCTDDNARALILAILLDQLQEAPKSIRTLTGTYYGFLHRAFDAKVGRFHNFMSSEGVWLDEKGSEDSHGRAVWALGTAAGRTPVNQLFTQALPAVLDFTSPRAWAFALIGIDQYFRHCEDARLASMVRTTLTERLVKLFDIVAQPGWVWFEEGLTYDNAKLAHALIATGHATGQESVRERGIRSLRWLVEVQTSQHGYLRPIGSNGFYPRNAMRANFDQQPIEAQSTVSACLEAYRVTSDSWWYAQAQSAFDWFLGWNDLGLEVYASQNGGCRDGLHPTRCNENQGAESMLAFLLSLAEMKQVQSGVTGRQQAGIAVPVKQ